MSPAPRPTRGFPSRRAWLLTVVEEAVRKLGRAVRTADLMDHLAEDVTRRQSSPTNLSATTVATDLLSLVQTGDLVVVAKLRGGAGEGGGSNLYLPSSLSANAEAYIPREPLTWLDLVVHAFDAAWEAERKASVAERRPPRPIATAQVKASILAMGGHPNLDNPQLLVNAMRALARGRSAHVRKIRGRRALWAPIDVDDEALDRQTFGSDPERLAESTRRAMARTGRPAVTQAEIAREIRADRSLRLKGRSRLPAALADACKLAVARGPRLRRKPQLSRAGSAYRRTYFVAADGDNQRLEEARKYVAWLRIRGAWDDLRPAAEMEGVAGCRLPTVAVGRARLLAAELRDLMARLDAVSAVGEPDGMARQDLERFRHVLQEALDSVEPWIRMEVEQPQNLDRSIPGWTDRDLARAYEPICPAAQRLRTTIEITRYVGKNLRRVPNPQFRSNRDPNPAYSVRFLFDRTDALLYAARHWGGRETRLQASAAAETLGPLRDPRFVYPALRSAEPEMRIRGAACLAYLEPTPEGHALLAEAARSDPDPGVRQVSLWAYGYTSGPEVAAFLEGGVKDPHPLVREFALEAQGHGTNPWVLL